jgi:hypothetical protein
MSSILIGYAPGDARSPAREHFLASRIDDHARYPMRIHRIEGVLIGRRARLDGLVRRLRAEVDEHGATGGEITAPVR